MKESEIYSLHQQAMDLAEQAHILKFQGKLEEAKKFFEQAYYLEFQSVEAITPSPSAEKSRSVMYSSAAHLANEAGLLHDCEKCCYKALAGDLPQDISESLKDLLEKVTFARHLELRGVELDPSEMQLSIVGNEVGFGLASFPEFSRRIDAIHKITQRTIEREFKQPFREAGPPKGDARKNIQFYVSIPRAASFAVTIKLGVLKNPDQSTLPGIEWEDYEPMYPKVINEIFENIEIVNSGKIELLDKKIKDEAYRTNFIALAKELAPDGKNVKLVGLTRMRGKQEDKLMYTATRKEISPQKSNDNLKQLSLIQESVDNRFVTKSGTLMVANAKKGFIKLIEDETAKEWTIKVPKGMMADVVKPHWEQRVQIEGVLKGNSINLEDIQGFE